MISTFLRNLFYRLPGIKYISPLIARVDRLENALQSEDAQPLLNLVNLRLTDARLRFLTAENLRLNEVVRALVFENRLKRPADGSFEYQWREIPDGTNMPSNPEFMAGIAGVIESFSQKPADWFRGKSILDAGCGSGRWSKGLLELGAQVTSIDQSESAIAAVTALCQGHPHHRVKRVDLVTMTEPVGQFDMVWCFGVCHHTSDMLRALANLCDQVAPKGTLFIMLYAYPENESAFVAQALYAEWRSRLAPLSYPERVAAIAKAFPGEDVHAYFDAMSPSINDLVTFEWIRTFLQDRGFTDVRRTVPDHNNHHVVATRA